jgi:hypothetical protein
MEYEISVGNKCHYEPLTGSKRLPRRGEQKPQGLRSRSEGGRNVHPKQSGIPMLQCRTPKPQ